MIFSILEKVHVVKVGQHWSVKKCQPIVLHRICILFREGVYGRHSDWAEWVRSVLGYEWLAGFHLPSCLPSRHVPLEETEFILENVFELGQMLLTAASGLSLCDTSAAFPLSASSLGTPSGGILLVQKSGSSNG